MSEQEITLGRFRELAEERFGFLAKKGFSRFKNLEETGSTGGTLVYLGLNVGFVFSLDLRDTCVDGYVVKVLNGEMKRNLDGGYSQEIYNHLVKHMSYRGGFGVLKANENKENSSEEKIIKMIDGYVYLLQGPGSLLLNDLAVTLPG